MNTTKKPCGKLVETSKGPVRCLAPKRHPKACWRYLSTTQPKKGRS